MCFVCDVIARNVVVAYTVVTAQLSMAQETGPCAVLFYDKAFSADKLLWFNNLFH